MKPAEVYIVSQDEPFRSILMHLQATIEHTLPDSELKYKWRIPCYYMGKRPLCYLNKTKDYVDVGFWLSAHLSKKWDAYLVSENRKIVKSLRYRSLEDIDTKILVSLLNEVKTLKGKGFYKRD